jgi:penicillin-binding protein 1A
MDQQNKSLNKTTKRILLGICAVPFVLAFIFLMMVYFGYFGPVPGTDELASIQNYEASQVYSSDGELLGTYYFQNRTEVSLEEINPLMTRALISVEDARFYEHDGVDERALARVLFKTILLGQDTGGGSTITQQLAKNLYPREETGWFHLVGDKFREMIIARRLERVYSKEKILSLYLNSVSFGEEIYGVEMAAQRFFSKDASELNLQEAATLTGLLKGTSWYNPRNHPERAKERRNVVLSQMATYGNLSPEVADSVMALPMQINYNRISSSEGPAPYFREHIRQQVSRILESKTAPDGKKYNLYTDGLVIQTTVDSRVQKAAENAVAAQMKELQAVLNQQIQRNPIFAEETDSTIHFAWRQSDQYQELKNAGRTDAELDSILYAPTEMDLFTWDGYEQRSVTPYDSLRHYLSFLNSGFLAMNPQNGQVMAWVGGINHKHFKYDHVKSKRQVGSAFKPIVYAAALEAGMRPCDYRRNVLTTYEQYEEWTPRNHADEYGGRYSLSAALAHSYNTIAVDLLMETGITEVQTTAQKMGIQSYIPSEPSIALGTAEVSLMELVTSYTTFLNEGKPAEPVLITSIKNAQGEVIYPSNDQTDENSQVSEVLNQESSLSPRTAATMVKMLEKVVNEGTGYRLRSRFGIQHALAGKTGTTQDYTDGWFVGMTPDMVFGSWVGGWNYRVRFTGNMGYASQTALPIAGRFLQNIQAYPEFEQPNQFYANQIGQSYRLTCPDFRPDKFSDRLRDFFKGRDEDEAVVDDGEERKTIFNRIRNLFSDDDQNDDSGRQDN